MYKATKDGQIIGKWGRPLKLVPKKNGYLYFSMSCGVGNPNQTAVHQFVWEYFNGPIPDGLIPDHKDANRHNNSLDNLQLITHKENTRKSSHVILTMEKAEEIRIKRKFTKGRVLAKEYGVSEQTISGIHTNRKWI